MTTTVHQIPDLGQVQTFAVGIKSFNGSKPSPFLSSLRFLSKKRD